MTIRETGREEIEIVLSLEEAEEALTHGYIRLQQRWDSPLRRALRREKELVDGLEDIDYSGAV